MRYVYGVMSFCIDYHRRIAYNSVGVNDTTILGVKFTSETKCNIPLPGPGIIYLNKQVYRILKNHAIVDVGNIDWCFDYIRNEGCSWEIKTIKKLMKKLRAENYVVARFPKKKETPTNGSALTTAVTPAPTAPPESSIVVSSPEPFMDMVCESDEEEVDYFSRLIDDIDMD